MVYLSTANGSPVTEPRKLMLHMWKMQVPYEEMGKALKVGIPYFVAGIKRQTAHRAKGIISTRLKFQVDAFQAKYGEEVGYVFVRGGADGLEEWLEKGKKEGWIE